MWLLGHLLSLSILTMVQSDWKDPLGKGFYLPNEEIGVTLKGGKSIFGKLPENCFHKKPDPTSVNDGTIFENTKSFYRTLSTDSGLSFNYIGKFTMGATLSVKTKQLSAGSVKVSGTSINIYNHVSTAILDKDCMTRSNLSNELMKDLTALPKRVLYPALVTSWSKYDTFLKKYGSHIVTHTYYGASIKHWTFAKKTEAYTEDQLKIKSCADFGVVGGVAKIEACTGISKTEVEKVKKLDMKSKLELRGGKRNTQNLLLKNRSDALITQFLNEGKELETRIKDKYTAIWEIMKWKYFSSNSTLYAIALNLEQYYMGFKEFGCSPIEKRGKQLRRFEFSPYSTEDIPQYRCVLEREGCHKDSDCKTGVGFESNCDGQTCVEHFPAPYGFKAERARMLKQKEGNSYEEISQSCDYNFTLKAGKCNSDYFENKVIWEHGRDIIQHPEETSESKSEAPENEKSKLTICCVFLFYIFTI